MPYAFAHPLAVVPLHRVLGKASAPSALVIGSVIPDAWYLIPGLARHDSHGLVYGVLLFCIPAGLLAYLAFHLIFKLPLLALLPGALAGRLRTFTAAGLPQAAWAAVLLSLAAGAMSHIAWDAVTHEGFLSELVPALAKAIDVGGEEFFVHQLLQHASTLLGTAALAWWIARKLGSVSPQPGVGAIPALPRGAVLALFLAIPAAIFAGVLVSSASTPGFGIDDLRRFARAGSVMALSVMGVLAMVYCLAWRLWPQSAR